MPVPVPVAGTGTPSWRRARWRRLAVAALVPLLALTTTTAHAQGVWVNLPSLPTARFAPAGAAAPCPADVAGLRGTCVYALGGQHGISLLDTVEAYSPATNTWAALPSMPTARRTLAGAAAPCPADVAGLRGTCVYALGGFNGGGPSSSNTVEAYSPATNTWAALPSMPTARGTLAGAAAPCPADVAGLRGTCVYALGGFNGSSPFPLGTVEAYSPATNTWAALPSMPTARGTQAGAAAPCPNRLRSTCVYAVGGSNDSSPGDSMGTVEAYSPASNTWAALPSMPTARENPAGAAAPCPGAPRSPCVYAVGGFNPQPGGELGSAAEAFAIKRHAH
ncbi:Kelch repeat-containing protein [Streptomyces sp. NPDC001978]|uniref:Kelch repeat-containing protein n=1 Tax=Streptomyces sp. NPDC001978 TaxID=3364627 RepID=UPI0036A106D7